MMGLMAASSLAAPLETRADYDAPPGGDVTILNYALTLEFLERKFYQEGLANYTEADFEAAGCDSDFYNNLKEIAYDEEVSTRRHTHTHTTYTQSFPPSRERTPQLTPTPSPKRPTSLSSPALSPPPPSTRQPTPSPPPTPNPSSN